MDPWTQGPGLEVTRQSEPRIPLAGTYAKNARYLNTQALLRKYGPVAFVVIIVFGGLYLRFFR